MSGEVINIELNQALRKINWDGVDESQWMTQMLAQEIAQYFLEKVYQQFVIQ